MSHCLLQCVLTLPCPAVLKVLHKLAGEEHNWPSLLVGPQGTSSDLHIDSMATHFWMFLVSGRKRWRVHRAEDKALLGFDEFQHFFIEEGTEDVRGHSQPWEFVLRPGQLLLVPHSMPHSVYNLEVAAQGRMGQPEWRTLTPVPDCQGHHRYRWQLCRCCQLGGHPPWHSPTCACSV